jgi:hypothetical protein
MDDHAMTGADTKRAETYLRLQTEAEIRLAVREEHVAEACLRRTASQAWALVGADVIDEATANVLIEDLGLALVARGLIDEGLLGARLAYWMRRKPLNSPLPGRLRAIPVGVDTSCKFQGRPLRMFLGTMILQADSAELTVVATASSPHPGLIDALGHCSASDDQARSYQLQLTGGGNDSRCEGSLQFSPFPPDGVRWLDITPPGADPVRVDVEAAAPGLPATTLSLPSETAADRYLDALAVRMLWRICGGEAAIEEPDVGAAIRGLIGAGVLTPGSTTLGRLVSTANFLGLDLAPAGAPDGRMPAHWLEMVRRRDARDGPTGAARLAGAVLPAVDGTRCVITDLASEPSRAIMRVHAWGWQPPHRGVMRPEAVCWTAHDDLGGFYAAAQRGGHFSSDRAEIVLELRPAIAPSATELCIVLTGKTGEVSVTVPLNWQPMP